MLEIKAWKAYGTKGNQASEEVGGVVVYDGSILLFYNPLQCHNKFPTVSECVP